MPTRFIGLLLEMRRREIGIIKLCRILHRRCDYKIGRAVFVNPIVIFSQSGVRAVGNAISAEIAWAQSVCYYLQGSSQSRPSSTTGTRFPKRFRDSLPVAARALGGIEREQS